MALYIKLHLASNNKEVAVNMDQYEYFTIVDIGTRIINTSVVESGLTVTESIDRILDIIDGRLYTEEYHKESARKDSNR